ncbi:MAG: AAA family ATPase [Methanobacteriota archaeon]|nr:MAG: AAA family ATPase [Euryarchaeota archaeon]
MIVAISGPPGSGKTTVAERLAKAKGFRFLSAGSTFREMAKDYAMSLEDFGRYAEAHQDVDRELDAGVVRRVEEATRNGGSVVVDGRLQPWLLQKHGIPCLKVLIDAPLDVRAQRIAGREGKAVKQAKKEIRERERSERTRYAKIYGIDIRDLGVFDLVVDSGDKSPDAIVSLVVERTAKWAT